MLCKIPVGLCLSINIYKGAYYYYQTEDGIPGKFGDGKNYEDTLIDVKKYADANAIPYKYVFYYSVVIRRRMMITVALAQPET